MPAVPQPWKRLGERTIAGSHAGTQVREMLNTLLPSAACPDGLLGTVEQAVLEAVARKQLHAGKEPLLIVSCLDTEGVAGPSDKNQAGWSFFVIERPGSTSNDVIELCLYHE